MESKYKDAIDQRVNDYVNPEYFDQDVVKEYLYSHSIVESEIFKLALKSPFGAQGRERTRLADSYYYGGRVVQAGRRSRVSVPDQSSGFYPTEIAKFLDRMPFYFYVNETKNRFGGFWESAMAFKSFRHFADFENKLEENAAFWEPLYDDLEFLFYDAHIPLKDIFTYLSTQTGRIDNRYDLFVKWVGYIKLCLKHEKTDDLTPTNLLFSLNTMLEEEGMNPIIYTPQPSMGFNEYFERTPACIVFGGEFPIDPETGEVVTRWMGIWTENVKFIRPRWFIESLDEEDEKYPVDRHHLYCEVEIGLLPDTIIYAANIDELYEENVPLGKGVMPEDLYRWFPVYFGPKQFTFNFDVIKAKREEYKWKQEDVAKRIGVNARTYQNWETHNTMPDAQNLIRLMNLFNIERIQDLMVAEEIPDPNFNKFRSGCALSMFLPKKEENK